MLFNSIGFFIFLPICFVLYWAFFATHVKPRNLFILVISYVFYGWWDWRYLFLMSFCSLVSFGCGVWIERTQKSSTRKIALAVGVILPLLVLGVYKYYDFFVVNFVSAFATAGILLDIRTLQIILPVGILFFTFQAVGYTTDVYRKNIGASRDPIAFLAFISFFPQLVAGPIERASNLLPQFATPRPFDRASAVDGLRQMLWGLFKKVVVADTCAQHVNAIFDNAEHMPSLTLTWGAVLFAFQIYCDFSGYSDIAIGCARLFGFSLMRNFAFPYFSRDMAEFWRRWHISLSTWFRDYLYVPLGGSRGTMAMSVRNTFIIFIVSGFWHGANWTFIIWGALNAVYFLPLLLTGSNRRYIGTVAQYRWLPSPVELLRMSSTFLLTCLAWIFFRSATVGDAFVYIHRIFSFTKGIPPPLIDPPALPILMGLVLVEWIQREKRHGLEMGDRIPKYTRWLIYCLLIFSIIQLGTEDSAFIYFQF